ncbi:hypothetical protein MRS76_21515 [Rhizobiaceae bacterium n13]|uniref:Uncharacterized protein n=1 Tax=Ferirhizobium litorale TaxID=2927786 RepID=A0AAE3U3S6_9HYPH|nr:hypothetical protein [Fererhizobium litorale]MDI7864518.1 hypothetical protein [Fererhizobium litorale]MDI7924941.1 hypothetical protein [Fererhizobium litorale]
MDRFLMVLGIAMAFVLFQVFISNPIAQKLLPTKTGDGFAHRVRYSVLHRIVFLALVIGVIGLLALFDA